MGRKGTLYDPIIISKSKADSRSLIMPHQQEAVDAMTEYYALEKDVPNRNGVVVMPTGSGKTYTAVTWLLKHGIVNDYRIVWLVHRQELVDQTFKEFRKQAPLLQGTSKTKLRVLAVSGAHLHMSMASKSDVYVCSIASVANKYGYRFIEHMLGAAGKRRVIVVIDEAHHAIAANYQKVLNKINKYNPNMVLLGLTATPIRMNKYEQHHLIRQFNIDYNIAHNIGKNGFVYEVTLKQLIKSGFLANPKYEKVKTEIVGEIEYDLSEEDEDYFERFGELSERLKNQIARSSARNKLILKKYLDSKKRYGKTLIFAVNQMHAETLCNEFKAAGVSCEFAVSSRADAQSVIKDFKNNKFDVLINVQIMTEGSDVPDIQTVFLTRETNSESLLMQMIGRGLRGSKVHGTEVAYIVAFHDTWDTFAYWLDPGMLDIFDVDPLINDETNEALPPIEPRKPEDIPLSPDADETRVVPKDLEISEVSLRDLYLKLYASVHASLTSKSSGFSFPIGWYSVIDPSGNEVCLLVYDCQKDAFDAIKRNINKIKDDKRVTRFINACFADVNIVPNVDELGYLIDYINEMDAMPPYFSFAERDLLDPAEIAKKMNAQFKKDAEKEEWLKALFDNSPIVQQIYKVFFAFKKTVFDTMKTKYDGETITKDERQKYEIVSNYFDLNVLLRQVLEMYPKLSTEGLVRIAWSKNIVRRWFALCQRDNTGKCYQITVNKVMSSPRIDREVIKYLIFHELLHENGYWNHDMEFRIREWQYPDSARLDSIMDSMLLDYNMDSIYEDSDWDEIPEFDIPLPNKNDIGDDTKQTNNEPVYNVSAPGIDRGFKYCRNCGNKLPEDARFCDRCGSKMDY